MLTCTARLAARSSCRLALLAQRLAGGLDALVCALGCAVQCGRYPAGRLASLLWVASRGKRYRGGWHGRSREVAKQAAGRCNPGPRHMPQAGCRAQPAPALTCAMASLSSATASRTPWLARAMLSRNLQPRARLAVTTDLSAVPPGHTLKQQGACASSNLNLRTDGTCAMRPMLTPPWD
jgi:hypothetical protein